MDKTDAVIIRRLAENAELSASDISPRINLSVPAINKRIAHLKDNGVIRRVTILTDEKKVGKSVIAFILVTLTDFSDSASFFTLVKQDPDILECYAITGEHDYLIKLCARDIDDMEDKLLKLKNNGVNKSQTLIGLREYKFSPTPLPGIE